MAIEVFLMQVLFRTPLTIIIFCYLIVLPQSLNAMPAQRIIVYFHQPLNSLQKIQIHNNLKTQLNKDYTLAEHSNDSRWIIIMSSKLNAKELNNVKKKLFNNKLIKYIETDDLLKPNSLIN